MPSIRGVKGGASGELTSTGTQKELFVLDMVCSRCKNVWKYNPVKDDLSSATKNASSATPKDVEKDDHTTVKVVEMKFDALRCPNCNEPTNIQIGLSDDGSLVVTEESTPLPEKWYDPKMAKVANP